MAQSNYNTEVLADSPVAFWKLDDTSGLPQDSSGNGNHFNSSSGTASYRQTGPFSGAFSIMLDGDSFTCEPPPTTLSDNMGFECWFSTVGAGNTRQVAVESTFGVNRYGVVASIHVNSYLNGGIVGTNLFRCPTQFAFFHYLRRAGEWETYINGDLYEKPSTSAPNTPIERFRISGNTGVQMYISNVSVYSAALSPTRIRTHYEEAIDYVPKPLQVPAMQGLSW